MCLLHKKNNKRNVSNYRPITLLNTDYKIFTKALAIKLAKTVPSIGELKVVVRPTLFRLFAGAAALPEFWQVLANSWCDCEPHTQNFASLQ
jgi:hypothetical protein